MSSNLSNAYNKLKNTKWSFSNTFRCSFNFNKSNTKTSKINGENYSNEVYLVKANIPALTATPDVNWIDHRNMQTMSTVEVMTINIDFLDHDQLELYRFWSQHFLDQLDDYLDNYKFSVDFIKLPDNPNEEEFVLFRAEDCIVNNVSQLDLSNNAEGSGTILTFSISFQTPRIIVNNKAEGSSISLGDKSTSSNVK